MGHTLTRSPRTAIRNIINQSNVCLHYSLFFPWARWGWNRAPFSGEDAWGARLGGTPGGTPGGHAESSQAEPSRAEPSRARAQARSSRAGPSQESKVWCCGGDGHSRRDEDMAMVAFLAQVVGCAETFGFLVWLLKCTRYRRRAVFQEAQRRP